MPSSLAASCSRSVAVASRAGRGTINSARQASTSTKRAKTNNTDACVASRAAESRAPRPHARPSNGKQPSSSRTYASSTSTSQGTTTVPFQDPAHLSSHGYPPASSASSAALGNTPLSPRIALEKLLSDLRQLLFANTGTEAASRHVVFPEYQGGYEEERAWAMRLHAAIDELSTRFGQTPRKTRIAVLGEDSAQLAQFTLALLEDPLASDTRPYEALRQRIRSQPAAMSQLEAKRESYKTTTIHFGDKQTGKGKSPGAEEVEAQVRWLHTTDVELTEAVARSTSTSPLRPSTWSHILASDIVIVLSDIVNKSDLARLSRKPNVIFAQSPTAPSVPSRLLLPAANTHAPPSQHIAKESISPPIQSMILDPAAAIQANDMLRNNRPYAGGVQASKEDFSSVLLRSGIPQLREVLEGLCVPHSPQSTSDPQVNPSSRPLHLTTASHLASSLLLSLSSALAESRSFLRTASSDLGQLDLRAARDKRHSEIELGFTDLGKLDLEMLVADNPAKAGEGVSDKAPSEKLREAAGKHHVQAKELVDAVGTKDVRDIELIPDGKIEVERALDAKRLRWYKLPFGRADDIATDLSNALTGYFSDLERKLIFETGRLSERSLALSSLVDSLFKPPSSFAPRPDNALSLHSATLRNQLASYSPTTQFGFPTPAHPSPLNMRQTSLSLPITTRKAQLVSAGGPIEKLQIRAQSAVLQFYGISGGLTALSVFLSQTPMQEFAVDVSTSIGIGLLGTVLAGWRLQGAWKKAKGRFWTDWQRAQEGLSYDLQENARVTLDQKVFKKADMARKLLRKQLTTREEALDKLERDLRRYQGEISVLSASRLGK